MSTPNWSRIQELAESGRSPNAECILELRARVEALEAAQLEQAESHRFCTDAIVRRVEALEAGATCPHIVSSDEGTSYCRLAEQTQDKLDRLIAMDRDDPDPAIAEFRAASAEARPAISLVDEVAYEAGLSNLADARAAIRAVAAWIRDRHDSDQVVHTAYEAAAWLSIAADRSSGADPQPMR